MVNFSNLSARVGVALLVVSMISACGGGGDSAPPVAAGPAAPAPSAVDSAATQPLAAYQGRWFGQCEKITSGFGVVVGSNLEVFDIKAPAANGTAPAFLTEQYFTTSDCTGTAVAVISDPSAALSSAGTKTVASITALKIDAAIQSGDSIFSGAAASAGGCELLLPGTQPDNTKVAVRLGSGADQLCLPYTKAQTASVEKIVFSPVSSINTFDIGNIDAGFDADGFPNSFLPLADGRLTKQ